MDCFFVQFIVPQSPWLTLKDVITELDRSFSERPDPPVNYIFSNNYFFTDFPATTPLSTTVADAPAPRGRPDLDSRLMTLRYRRRAPISNYGYAVKSIVNPRACRQMHNHYCWAVISTFQKRGYIEVVSDKVAVNQHYKPCHLNATECATAFRDSRLDDVTMARYRDKLVSNVEQRIRDIFALSPSQFLRQFYRNS